MLRIAAVLIATYLAAFLVTSAVTAPDGLQAAIGRLSSAAGVVAAWPSGAQALARGTAASAELESFGASAQARIRKSAALPRLRGAQGATPLFEPSEIEATMQGKLVIRDADGHLLYLRDPHAGEIAIARGARLPRLLAEPTGDTPRLETAPRFDPGETETPDGDGAPLAAGCESAVSPLARTRRATGGVLCLATL